MTRVVHKTEGGYLLQKESCTKLNCVYNIYNKMIAFMPIFKVGNIIV